MAKQRSFLFGGIHLFDIVCRKLWKSARWEVYELWFSSSNNDKSCIINRLNNEKNYFYVL